MLWHLRLMGLLIAATFACMAGHSTGAEPRHAEGCRRAAFRVIIDVGHTEQAPGATSARGVSEFAFNVNLARRIEQQLVAAGVPAQRALDHRRSVGEGTGGARRARQCSRS